MNKKFYLSCFICIFTLLLSVTFYFNKQTIIESENRSITAFPEFPKKISPKKIKLFFTQLSEFYNDNFPNREKIILSLTRLIPSVNPEIFSYRNIIIGKNDWLYLGNKYGNTIDELTGKLYYHDDTNNQQYSITTRYNFYKETADKTLTQNKSIFFLIGPNKSSIYPEFLPNTITPAAKPFHEDLLQKMRQEGLTVYYPRQDLLQAKDKALLYHVTDTHWNYYGAFIVFINLIPQLNPDYRNIIKEEDFSFKPEKSSAGDLIGIGNLTFKNKDYHDTFEVFYKNMPLKTPNAEQAKDELIKNKQPVIHSFNPDALIDKTVFVIGDSFTYSFLYQYFIFFFKHYYFTHHSNFVQAPFENFKDIHADYVIYETVERNF